MTPRKSSCNSSSNGDDRLLKMKALVEATGVRKATVLFYINEGLLLQPIKTSPNVSFYPASIIEKNKFHQAVAVKASLQIISDQIDFKRSGSREEC